MAGTIHTIEDVAEALNGRDQASLDAASAECLRLGHEWWELRTNTMGKGPAHYCWRCLRVRVGGAEFGLKPP